MKSHIIPLAILILAACVFVLSCGSANSNTAPTEDNRRTVVVNNNQTRTNELPSPMASAPIQQNSPAPVAQNKTVKAPSEAGMRLASFDRLKTGMSYAEAVKVLGSPGTTQGELKTQGGTMKMYNWKGTDSNGEWSIAARFDNGKLVSKTQFGLK